MPETLTPIEVAKVCKVTRRTVYAWVERGILPQPQRLGRLLRFQKDAVEKLLGGSAVQEPVAA